ncbi:MAG: hypothetical protein O2907_07885, partial [Proteobacteria bacterium]|nr:hypothetical protein [Pseudomonadota bacterium]
DDAYDDAVGDEELSREQEVERRIFELENADVPVQRSLIEIRDNELAALRAELAQIRVEVYEPESDDPFADDETSGEPVADPDADDTVVETTPEPEPVVRPARQSKPGLVEQILDVLSSWWIPIAGVLVVVGGLLFWFMRRGSGDDDESSTWRSLDADDVQRGDLSATESMRAPKIEDSSSLDETGEMPAIAATDFDLDLDDLTAALEVSEIGDTIEQMRDDATVEQRRPRMQGDDDDWSPTLVLEPGEMSDDLHDARTMTEVGTKLDLARAYVDMGDPSGARSILEEVLDEGDAAQRQQAQQLLDSLPS